MTKKYRFYAVCSILFIYEVSKTRTRMQERSENPFLMKQAQNVAQGQAVASGRQNMTMGAYWNQQAVG